MSGVHGEDARPKIGWIGDAWSGTLTCNVPGCGWESFVSAFEAEDEAEDHWATHIGSSRQDPEAAT